VSSVRDRLLDWYRANRRDLPWRTTRDPYAVWISEVMLQQTRVDTVIPYYERFLATWPTVSALADADPEAVRAAWSGLGYYRRARLMQDAARRVVDQHGGALPGEAAALRTLPGFGPYTAGAVASIAFDRPAAAVDGNVARVLSRIEGIRGDVSRGAPLRQVWAKAEALAADALAPGELTQALIELGAMVCSPRKPACGRCPLAADCFARRHGLQAEIPQAKKRAARSRIELTAIVAPTGAAEIVLEQRPEDGLFAALWLPPILDGHLDPAAAADEAERRWRWEIDRAEDAGEITHVLTHRDVVMRLVRARARTKVLPPPLRAVDLRALGALGIPSVTTRALRAALPEELLGNAHLPGRRRPGSRIKGR
jgi:A/G-specific adenine glycosylase